MSNQADILKDVMSETKTSQSELSRLSGVHQPSISQFISGKKGLSDELLDRLLSAMGARLEVSRRAVKPRLTRSERRSWLLHRSIAAKLDDSSLEAWTARLELNLKRLRDRTTGQPHERNLERWEELLSSCDVAGLRRVLTGLDRDSIEMREVSPMQGVISQAERSEILEVGH